MFISAFDLDHTLLNVNSSFHFGRYLFKSGRLTPTQAFYLTSCYCAHKVGFVGLDRLHHLNFNVLFRGVSKKIFEECASKFLDLHLQAHLYAPVFEVLKKAQRAGHYTALLSSSPDFLVDAIAARFAFDLSASTSYLTDSSGCFSQCGLIMHGTAKASLLKDLAKRLQVSKANIYAYSDSHLDLPFLDAAGCPVAVRPDRLLRTISKRKGWTIIP